jgi:hypothetical protein
MRVSSKFSFSQFLPFLIFGLVTQVITLLQKPDPNISSSSLAFCNYYINKFRYFNVHIDCDAQYFLLDSQNPHRILSYESPLQDRPLHTFIVYVISKILEFFGIPEGPITYLGEDSIPQTYHLLNYLIFIGINGLILIASVALVLKVLYTENSRPNRPQLLWIFLIVLMLVQNPINREFFWTPHSQLFNILIPCLIFYLLQPNYILTKRKLLLLILALASLLMMYPTFILVLPIVYIKAYKAFGKISILFVTFAVVPKAIWPIVLGLFGGYYVDHTVQTGRRFVWVLDSIKEKSITQDFADNAVLFIHSLSGTWVVIVAVLSILGIYMRSIPNFLGKNMDSSYNRNSILVLITYFMGMYFNGQYAPRFTLGLVILYMLILTKKAIDYDLNRKGFWFFGAVLILINLFDWVFG